MHKLKTGEKKELKVRIYESGEPDYRFIFHDTYEEYNDWVIKEMNEGRWKLMDHAAAKDINYLLNAMVKAKGTRKGEILFEIYTNYYPDDDQMKKVKEFWNK